MIRRAVNLGSAPLKVIYRGDIKSVDMENYVMFMEKKGGVYYADVYPSVASVTAPSWITTEVVNGNTVKFTVDENTYGQLRYSTVTITGSQSSSAIVVNQYGS